MALDEALDTYGEWAQQPTEDIRAATGGGDTVGEARARAHANERSFSQLQTMMGGTR